MGARAIALVMLMLKTAARMEFFGTEKQLGNSIDYTGMVGEVAFALALYFFVDMCGGAVCATSNGGVFADGYSMSILNVSRAAIRTACFSPYNHW